MVAAESFRVSGPCHIEHCNGGLGQRGFHYKIIGGDQWQKFRYRIFCYRIKATAFPAAENTFWLWQMPLRVSHHRRSPGWNYWDNNICF